MSRPHGRFTRVPDRPAAERQPKPQAVPTIRTSCAAPELGYIQADPLAAKYWYRIAVALGNNAAKRLLDALDQQQGT